MENTIVMAPSSYVTTPILAPVAGALQGIAVPASGLKRRPRPATSGTDLRHRTP